MWGMGKMLQKMKEQKRKTKGEEAENAKSGDGPQAKV